jgi:hypothetical protein
LLESPEEGGPSGDFWIVDSYSGTFYVSGEVAREVACRLDGMWVPRWLTFVDLAGSRVRLRGGDVRLICESTELQRTRERSFHRARREEENADRSPWEDEE